MKQRGRPATGFARSPAERMRAYRRRLREKGVVLRATPVLDPIAQAVRFGASCLLTPAEQDVLRRFCAGFGRLPVLPSKAAVFGSRAKGGSTIRSDLDVAVILDCPRDPRLEQALYALAEKAQAAYQEAEAGIHLRAVPIFARDQRAAFFRAIKGHMETVWTRPR